MAIQVQIIENRLTTAVADLLDRTAPAFSGLQVEVLSRVGQNGLLSASEDGISEDRKETSISNASSPEEIAQFWDTHSLDDYWDETREVEFEVRAQQRRRVTLDPELYAKIEIHARQRGVLPETLVSIWLTERIQEAS